jgi:pimeloyl-ACP methyl ester carboxylesterase
MLSRATDPADGALMSDPVTGPVIRRAVAEGLTKGRASYLREISAYVMPWGRHLAHVSCPVTLHHGDADCWAPFVMAEALARALPNANVVRYASLGHYSTLCAALPTLTADAGTEAC